jgi:hypothetical protein
MTHQSKEIEEPIPMNSFRMRIMKGEAYHQATDPNNYTDLLHDAAKVEDALYNMIKVVRVLQKENDALLKDNNELRQQLQVVVQD